MTPSLLLIQWHWFAGGVLPPFSFLFQGAARALLQARQRHHITISGSTAFVSTGILFIYLFILDGKLCLNAQHHRKTTESLSKWRFQNPNVIHQTVPGTICDIKTLAEAAAEKLSAAGGKTVAP